MECQRCESTRIMHICAKCSDCCSIEYQGYEASGYVPHLGFLGGGDYIDMDVCLECGQIQSVFPIPEDALELF